MLSKFVMVARCNFDMKTQENVIQLNNQWLLTQQQLLTKRFNSLITCCILNNFFSLGQFTQLQLKLCVCYVTFLQQK